MTDSSERIDFVLNILREICVEDERNLFSCDTDQSASTNASVFDGHMECLRDPFDDSENEDGNSKIPPKNSMNAKYKELRSSRSRIKTPDLLVATETEESLCDEDFKHDMIKFMDSIGLNAYKAEKQRVTDELEVELRRSKGKHKPPPPKKKVQDDGDVESLTGFTKLAEMHERPKGFPITTPHYNILQDAEQLDWLQTKSVSRWDSIENSKRKCVKWLNAKTD